MQIPLKEGIGGERRRPKDRVREDKVTSRITLLSSGILSGILDPVHEMGFGLCMKTSKKRFCHSLHFPNMSQKVNSETKGWDP